MKNWWYLVMNSYSYRTVARVLWRDMCPSRAQKFLRPKKVLHIHYRYSWNSLFLLIFSLISAGLRKSLLADKFFFFLAIVQYFTVIKISTNDFKKFKHTLMLVYMLKMPPGTNHSPIVTIYKEWFFILNSQSGKIHSSAAKLTTLTSQLQKPPSLRFSTRTYKN